MAVKIIANENEQKKRLKRKIRRRKGIRRKLFRLTITFIVFIFLIYSGIRFLVSKGIKHELTINTGDSLPSIGEFITSNLLFGYFEGEYRGINTHIPGRYNVLLNVYGMKFNTKLNIVDNVAPVLILKPQKVSYPNKLSAMDFVKSLTDDSHVDVDFLDKPNFEMFGEQDITIVARDASGNETKGITTLEIIKDDTPPIFHGLENKVVKVGGKVSYRSSVKAIDDVDGEVNFEVDNSDVNLAKEGKYKAIYTARDSSGNLAKEEIDVIVRTIVDESTTSQSELDELADKVLSRIIKDDMTYIQKLRAIYDYVHDEIAYVGRTTRTGRIDAAYDAMKNRRGDCYNFYAVSMTLIDKIGGETLYIARTPKADTKHFWILVKYDGQWYHFDPSNSPTRRNFDCFMKSDPEVEEFTKRVWNIIPQYYEYEKADYPAVAKTPLEFN